MQINGLEFWDNIITENRWIFSAKSENKGSHYNPLPLPAKFCFVEISPGEILWMRIFTMVKFRGCEFSPRWNFSKTKFHFSDAKFHQDESKISLDSTKIHGCLQNFVEFSWEQRTKSAKFRFHFFCTVLSTNLIQASMLMLKLMCQLVLNRVWQIFRSTFMNGSNNGGSWTEQHHCHRKEISCQVGLWTFFLIILSVITCWS